MEVQVALQWYMPLLLRFFSPSTSNQKPLIRYVQVGMWFENGPYTVEPGPGFTDTPHFPTPTPPPTDELPGVGGGPPPGTGGPEDPIIVPESSESDPRRPRRPLPTASPTVKPTKTVRTVAPSNEQPGKTFAPTVPVEPQPGPGAGGPPPGTGGPEEPAEPPAGPGEGGPEPGSGGPTRRAQETPESPPKYHLKRNPFSWSESAHMLFLEQVGVMLVPLSPLPCATPHP